MSWLDLVVTLFDSSYLKNQKRLKNRNNYKKMQTIVNDILPYFRSNLPSLAIMNYIRSYENFDENYPIFCLPYISKTIGVRNINKTFCVYNLYSFQTDRQGVAGGRFVQFEIQTDRFISF